MGISFVRKIISYSDIYGHKPTVSEIQEILKGFRLSHIIEIIAKLNFLLFKEDYSKDLQEYLASQLLSTDIHKRAIHESIEGNSIIFNRMQLLWLLQIACSVCDDNDSKSFEDKESRFEFGLSALMANDFLSDKENFAEKPTHIEILPFLIDSFDVSNFLKGADIVHPMVRWYVMLFEIAQETDENFADVNINSLTDQ